MANKIILLLRELHKPVQFSLSTNSSNKDIFYEYKIKYIKVSERSPLSKYRILKKNNVNRDKNKQRQRHMLRSNHPYLNSLFGQNIPEFNT